MPCIGSLEFAPRRGPVFFLLGVQTHRVVVDYAAARNLVLDGNSRGVIAAESG